MGPKTFLISRGFPSHPGSKGEFLERRSELSLTAVSVLTPVTSARPWGAQREPDVALCVRGSVCLAGELPRNP